MRWFDYHLKGIRNGLDQEPPVRIFVMGDNVWRDEHEWPLARTRFTPVYLSSGGQANSLRGDGHLTLTTPVTAPLDSYVYDPANPVPTCGGTYIGPGNGVRNQAAVEERNDVLVYTGDILERDLEVTGPVVVKLYAASSAPDTDFTAKLVDVRPDGYACNIAEGVVRARFRDSLQAPTLIAPGEISSTRSTCGRPARSSRQDIACGWKYRQATFRATTATRIPVMSWAPTPNSIPPNRPCSTTSATRRT